MIQRIHVEGALHGLGFIPFVFRLAQELQLSGWVRKVPRGVEIEAAGSADQIDQLLTRLRVEAPPLVVINSLTQSRVSRRAEVSLAEDVPSVSVGADSFSAGFVMLPAHPVRPSELIAPDVAVCRDCLLEMFDPAPSNRRWRYPFTHCAHCGPRYTVSRGGSYGRAHTSFKAFPFCNKCQHEYRQEKTRRFHSEIHCCPKCGPQLAAYTREGSLLSGDAIALALASLQQGKILAIKNYGGFSLICDARNPAAVARLRTRKRRAAEPFSVMLANAASAAAFAQVMIGEPGLLNLPERPRIALKKRSTCDGALLGVAPGVSFLSVVLAQTPLHYLLFHEAAGRPSGSRWLDAAQELVLLTTGATPGGQPLITDNAEALRCLSGVADVYLMHDLEINQRCDDSVAHMTPSGLQLIRRAQGYTLRPIKLPCSGPSVLALGGGQRNTICVTRGDEAFLSPPIANLDNATSCTIFEEQVETLLKMLDLEPSMVVHDLDMTVHASIFARHFAEQRALPRLPIQHHQAHAAAVFAEHGLQEQVLALVLDSPGLGSDTHTWGGELFLMDSTHCQRRGHLSTLILPGAEAVRHAPWRMAAAALHQLGRGAEIAERFAQLSELRQLDHLLKQAKGFQQSSSVANFFDAAAGLLGVINVAAFNGQSAFKLEALAERYGDVLPVERGWHLHTSKQLGQENPSTQLDLLPLLAILADEKNAERGAAIFHATLIAALADWVYSVAPKNGIVIAAGDYWLNPVLARGLRARLGAHGLRLLEAHHVPPNDGGLAFGQAWLGLKHVAQSESQFHVFAEP
ncbi:MAG: carbamoyltransferase HypF [Pseudomonadota bacterium]